MIKFGLAELILIPTLTILSHNGMIVYLLTDVNVNGGRCESHIFGRCYCHLL